MNLSKLRSGKKSLRKKKLSQARKYSQDNEENLGSGIEEDEAPKSARILRGKMRELLSTKSNNRRKNLERDMDKSHGHNDRQGSTRMAQKGRKKSSNSKYSWNNSRKVTPVKPNDQNFTSHDSRVMNYGSMAFENENIYDMYDQEDINYINRKMDSLFRDTAERKDSLRPSSVKQRVHPKIEFVLREH